MSYFLFLGFISCSWHVCVLLQCVGFKVVALFGGIFNCKLAVILLWLIDS